MVNWSRAHVDTLCGYCGGLILKGEPIFIRTVTTVKKVRVRCENCAGAAPPDLPALVERSVPVLGGFDAIQSVRPKTRGELKSLVKEWMPYRESPERE